MFVDVLIYILFMIHLFELVQYLKEYLTYLVVQKLI